MKNWVHTQARRLQEALEVHGESRGHPEEPRAACRGQGERGGPSQSG